MALILKEIEPYIKSTEIDNLRKGCQKKKKKKKKKEKTSTDSLGKFYALDEKDLDVIKSVMPNLDINSLNKLDDLSILELVKKLREVNNDSIISKINYKTPESLIKDALRNCFNSYFAAIEGDMIKAISPLSPIFSDKFTWPSEKTLEYVVNIMSYYEGNSETRSDEFNKDLYKDVIRHINSQGIKYDIRNKRSRLLKCISKILKEKKEIPSCYFKLYFDTPSLTPIEISICRFASIFICQKDDNIRKLIEYSNGFQEYNSETRITNITDQLITLIIKFPNILEHSKEKFSELLRLTDFPELYFNAFMIARLELFPHLLLGSENDSEANNKFYAYAEEKKITNFINRDNLIKAWSMSLFNTIDKGIEDIFNYLDDKESTTEYYTIYLRLGYFFPIEMRKCQRNYVEIFQEETIEEIITMLEKRPKIFNNYPDKGFEDLDHNFYKKYIQLHDEIISKKYFKGDYYNYCVYKGIASLFNRFNLLYAWAAVNLEVSIDHNNLKFTEYLKIILRSVQECNKKELYSSLMFYFDITSSVLAQDYQSNPFDFLNAEDELVVAKLDKDFRSKTDEIELIKLSYELEIQGHINIVNKIIYSRPCDIIRKLFKPSIDRYLNSEQKDIIVPNPIIDKDFTWSEEINEKICQLGKYYKIQKREAGTLDYKTIKGLEIKTELKTADDVYTYILRQLN